VDEDNDQYSGYEKNIQDRREKAQIVHKWWEQLYDNVGSKNLRMQRKGISTKINLEVMPWIIHIWR